MATINHPLPGARRGPLRIPRPHGGGGLWLAAAIALAIVAAALPVVQNSTATSEGFDLQAFQRQEAGLNAEIAALESDVARLTSYTRIERRAQEIGMVPAQDPTYVDVNEPGPAPAKLPADYLPRATPLPDSPDPWWKPLVDWLP